jgi:hypothetical protein
MVSVAWQFERPVAKPSKMASHFPKKFVDFDFHRPRDKTLDGRWIQPRRFPPNSA